MDYHLSPHRLLWALREEDQRAPSFLPWQSWSFLFLWVPHFPSSSFLNEPHQNRSLCWTWWWFFFCWVWRDLRMGSRAQLEPLLERECGFVRLLLKNVWGVERDRLHFRLLLRSFFGDQWSEAHAERPVFQTRPTHRLWSVEELRWAFEGQRERGGSENGDSWSCFLFSCLVPKSWSRRDREEFLAETSMSGSHLGPWLENDRWQIEEGARHLRLLAPFLPCR